MGVRRLGLAAFCSAGFLAALPAAAQIAAAQIAAAQTGAPQPMVSNGRFTMQGGEAVYKNLCAACHMPDAKGAAGAGVYPALAGNRKLAAAAYPVRLVIHGQKGMPAFGSLLDNDQIAAVATYVRTHFGNAYAAPVTEAEVQAMR
jgi:mono/diheme cytochrome c family protein